MHCGLGNRDRSCQPQAHVMTKELPFSSCIYAFCLKTLDNDVNCSGELKKVAKGHIHCTLEHNYNAISKECILLISTNKFHSCLQARRLT